VGGVVNPICGDNAGGTGGTGGNVCDFRNYGGALAGALGS